MRHPLFVTRLDYFHAGVRSAKRNLKSLQAQMIASPHRICTQPAIQVL